LVLTEGRRQEAGSSRQEAEIKISFIDNLPTAHCPLPPGNRPEE